MVQCYIILGGWVVITDDFWAFDTVFVVYVVNIMTRCQMTLCHNLSTVDCEMASLATIVAGNIRIWTFYDLPSILELQDEQYRVQTAHGRTVQCIA